MWRFSTRSATHLRSAHPALIEACSLALEISPVDFGISCGYRGREEQTVLHAAGMSQLEYPHSKHNKAPSEAVDVFPYVRGKGAVWDDDRLFFVIAGLVLGIGHARGHKMRWGGAWKGSLNLPGQFKDLPHIELVEVRK